jgi:hypothetical protein
MSPATEMKSNGEEGAGAPSGQSEHRPTTEEVTLVTLNNVVTLSNYHKSSGKAPIASVTAQLAECLDLARSVEADLRWLQTAVESLVDDLEQALTKQ